MPLPELNLPPLPNQTATDEDETTYLPRYVGIYVRMYFYVCRGALGASGLALQDERESYIRRNTYILSGVIMTLELVAQVGR